MIIKPAEKTLLADTVYNCLQNKIKILLKPQRTYRGSSGWVDGDTFMCCLDPNGEYDTNWGIFVHESCHIDQLIDPNSIWHKPDTAAEQDWMDLHTKGKTRKSKKIENYFKGLLALELDCEKRAVEKIKKYKLNINLQDYVKRGNVYLFSYYTFYHQKCWYDKNFRIYDQHDLVENMPETYFADSKSYWKKHSEVWNCLKKHNNMN